MPYGFVPVYRIIYAKEANGMDLQVQNPVILMFKKWLVLGSKGDKHTLLNRETSLPAPAKVLNSAATANTTLRFKTASMFEFVDFFIS